MVPADVLQTFASYPDVGQGSGAVAWLTGNFIGSGTTEIVQLWDNQGTLSWLLYTFAGGNLQGDWLKAAWVRDRVPWPG